MVKRVPCEVVLESVGAQEGWEYFKEVILNVQELIIPKSRKMSQRARRSDWMNRDLWLELKSKRKVYGLWKSGQATYDCYRYVVKLFENFVTDQGFLFPSGLLSCSGMCFFSGVM